MSMDYELSREFECYAAAIESSKLIQEIHGIMADIPGLLKTVSASAGTLQKLADIAMQTQNVELREGILSVREELINVKASLLEIKEENLDLREENKDLRNRVEQFQSGSEEKLKFVRGYYFTKDNRGPYCPQCWESSRTKSLMSSRLKGGRYCSSKMCGYEDVRP